MSRLRGGSLLRAPVASQRFVSGSRAFDVLLFLLLASAVVASSYRLRVYYQVTIAEAAVALVDADGGRRALPTPDELHGPWSTMRNPEVIVNRLERHIETYMRSTPSKFPPGTRVEWTIRYGTVPTRLDHTRVLTVVAGDAAAR